MDSTTAAQPTMLAANPAGAFGRYQAPAPRHAPAACVAAPPRCVSAPPRPATPAPARLSRLRKESAQHVSALLALEPKYSVCADYIVTVQKQGMEESWRDKIVDWFVKMVEAFEMSAETVAITVSYFDRYMSKRSCAAVDVQLVAVACIFLASKLEEVVPFRVQQLQVCWEFSRDKLLNVERRLLKCFRFELNPPTGYHFVSHYLLFAPCHPLARQALCGVSFGDGSQAGEAAAAPSADHATLARLTSSLVHVAIGEYALVGKPASTVGAAVLVSAFTLLGLSTDAATADKWAATSAEWVEEVLPMGVDPCGPYVQEVANRLTVLYDEAFPSAARRSLPRGVAGSLCERESTDSEVELAMATVETAAKAKQADQPHPSPTNVADLEFLEAAQAAGSNGLGLERCRSAPPVNMVRPAARTAAAAAAAAAAADLRSASPVDFSGAAKVRTAANPTRMWASADSREPCILAPKPIPQKLDFAQAADAPAVKAPAAVRPAAAAPRAVAGHGAEDDDDEEDAELALLTGSCSVGAAGFSLVAKRPAENCSAPSRKRQAVRTAPHALS